MPVDQYGRWESWGKRLAREPKPTPVPEAGEDEPADEPVQPKRRTRKAAAAAIAGATGIDVTLEAPEGEQ